MTVAVFVPKADVLSDYPLLASAARTASDVTSDFQVDGFSTARVIVTSAAPTGTSPTLDVYIQRRNTDGTTYDDIAHFTQVTGALSTPLALDFVNGGNLMHTTGNAALAANTVIGTNFGNWWRIRFVLAGTNPSFTFGVFANFSS